MRFLVDAQLPPAVARWLTEEGHDAQHVFDLGLHQATDRAIWAKARELTAAIITKDEDFVTLVTLDPAQAAQLSGCGLATRRPKPCSSGWPRCSPGLSMRWTRVRRS